MAQYFNGKFLVQPQASVYVDNSRLANLNPGAANIIALVGPCTAGVPQQAIQISDPNAARRILRSGDLLDAIMLAFDPSSQTGGASTLWAVRVNNAVAGRAKILDSATPAKATQTITIGGTAAGGQVYTATINGVAVTYTAQGGDTNTNIAAGLAAAIVASTNATVNDVLTGVTATSAALIVTVQAKYAGVDGNAITLTSGATGTGTAVSGGGTLTGGTGNTLATMTAADYGLYTNQINFTMAAASVKGTKVTIALTTSGNIIGGTLVQDNLFRDLINIQYTGAGSAATITINDSSLTTTCTGAPADNLNISFATFSTVQQVVDAIAATGKYTVTLAAASSATLASASQFDPRAAADVKTGSLLLSGNLQAVLDFINSPQNIFSSAVRKANPAAGTPGYATAASYFVGGSDGTTTQGDWTTSIASLQTIECDIVVPVTGDAAVHASTLTHVNYMSTTGRKPRVCVLGGVKNEYNPAAAVPTQTLTNRAVALNSNRAVLVAPGVKVFDINGNLVTRDPYFTAAMFGGMLAAVPAGTALTHKYFSNVSGMEVNFTPADLDALLLGGVAPIEYVTNRGFRIVQSKTTWLGAPNFADNEISTRRAIDTVVRRVQDTLDEQLVGQKVAPETLAQAVSITETVLKQAKIDGLIVGDTASPAFKSISASTSGGDTIRVQFQMSPAIPANYILVSVATVPYTGVVGTSS
jgi:hypothetical protein